MLKDSKDGGDTMAASYPGSTFHFSKMTNLEPKTPFLSYMNYP